MMDDMILSVNTLPEPLHRRIRSDRVRVHEENGVIILAPIENTNESTAPKRQLGFVKNIPPLPESFFDPLPEEDLQVWGL